MVENIEKHPRSNDTAPPGTCIPIALKNVNCYLVKISEGYILIDTGFTKNRKDLENQLVEAGCKPGNLKLILLTHGDFDHIGSGNYLREKFGAKIAMHKGDSGMAEKGNMFWNRNVNAIIKFLIKFLLLLVRLKLKKADRFTPDIYVEDGDDLSEYGFDAKVVHIPGHSKGSIGILTNDGDLFCGDLLQNNKKPEKFSLIDNEADFDASIEKLKGFKINTVFPGHGKPFPIEEFIKNN